MEEYQDRSLGGRVFKRLREDILKGRYKQQDELREATIGKELGVSRTPVREALRQLELEGLVTIVPNKGAYVTGISQKDIWDIYQMRKYLEGMCARWAAEHITEDQLEELEETILLSEFQMKKENGYNKEQVTGLDGRFHTILYEASGSRMLCHVLTDFHRYVQMARKSSINVKARAEKSIEEHKAILQAIRDRNPDLAEQLAKEHIVHVMQNLKKIEEKHNQEVAKDGKMKAVVSITLDDEFVVHDIKVIEGEKGLFIAMPSRKASDGEYRDIAHPINSETRERIQTIILEQYEKAAAESAEAEEAAE